MNPMVSLKSTANKRPKTPRRIHTRSPIPISRKPGGKAKRRQSQSNQERCQSRPNNFPLSRIKTYPESAEYQGQTCHKLDCKCISNRHMAGVHPASTGLEIPRPVTRSGQKTSQCTSTGLERDVQNRTRKRT